MGKIRMATAADTKAILDIYAPYIEHTNVTFEYVVPTEAEFAGRIQEILENILIWSMRKMALSAVMPMPISSWCGQLPSGERSFLFIWRLLSRKKDWEKPFTGR